MARKILFRRGNKNALPTLSAGEPAFALDTKELYIGTGDGTASVVGSGDMLKSVYDTNNNGKVDDADKLGGQPPEYYAENVPIYNGYVDMWSSSLGGDDKYWLTLDDAPNIIENRVEKFAVDLSVNYAVSDGILTQQLYLLLIMDGGTTYVKDSLPLRALKANTAMRTRELAMEYYRYYFEYNPSVDSYMCVNPLTKGTNGRPGLCTVTDRLDRSVYVQGEALSAHQGYVLKNMIDNIVVLRDKPTLTALTPVGTTVGSSGWTGTGEFNTNASSNNSHDVFSSQIGSGYLRLNLKLAAGEDWQDWSPYYDKDGEEFPFYYSEARGLYDGIIPDEGLTLQQAVDKIRWVYRRKPDIMIYGSLGGIMMVRSTTVDGQEQTTYIVTTDIGRMWRCGTGDYGDNSDTFAYRMAMRSIKLTQLNLPAPLMVKIALTADVEGVSSINASTSMGIGRIMSGVNTAPEICGIDNWGA